MATLPLMRSYQIRYRTAEQYDDLGSLKQSAGEWQLHPEQVRGTSVTLNGLEPSTIYEIQVRAIDETGSQAWSESSFSRTPAGDGSDG